jgi:uncharacterized phiE125 gp8 family phage protein
MVLNYKELSSPAVEPVTLSHAKRQLVVDASFTDDDEFITSLIITARQHCEKLMQRAVYDRDVLLSLDAFPIPTFGSTLNPSDRRAFYTGTYIWEHLAIRLPLPACQSVTSITFYDQAGNQYTVDPATYNVDTISEPCRIVPKWSCTWPTAAYFTPGSVQVTFVAGTYGDGVETNTCPEPIKQAILLLVSYWYQHRDSAELNATKQIEFGVDALLTPYMFDTYRWN